MSDDKKVLIGKVIKVINENSVVINKGSRNGLENRDTFLIYREDEELFDPDTNESLGKLEIVKGRGKISHLQEKNSTLSSIEIKRIRKSNNVLFGGLTTEEVDMPFANPEIGDFAKLI